MMKKRPSNGLSGPHIVSGFTDIRSTMKNADIFKGLPYEFWILFDIQFQTLKNFKCLGTFGI
jgi:hypothetical protein